MLTTICRKVEERFGRCQLNVRIWRQHRTDKREACTGICDDDSYQDTSVMCIQSIIMPHCEYHALLTTNAVLERNMQAFLAAGEHRTHARAQRQHRHKRQPRFALFLRSVCVTYHKAQRTLPRLHDNTATPPYRRQRSG